MGDDTAPQYKVFVGGLTWDLTNEQLQEEFKDFAASKAEIMVDKMSGRSRGFGFVWFDRRQDMEDAIKDKNKSSIKDREISVKEAIPEDKIPPGQRQRDRYRGAPRGGYERGGYGGGYERGYESRGGGGGYDSRSAGYGGGYGGGYGDRGGYGGYSGYGYDSYGGYGGGYDSRAGYGDRSASYGSYAGYGGGYGDSRGYGGGSGGSYGPERSASRGPAAPRTDPYARR